LDQVSTQRAMLLIDKFRSRALSLRGGFELPNGRGGGDSCLRLHPPRPFVIAGAPLAAAVANPEGLAERWTASLFCLESAMLGAAIAIANAFNQIVGHGITLMHQSMCPRPANIRIRLSTGRASNFRVTVVTE